MRRRFMILKGGGDIPPNNQIWYTSTDGSVITPYNTGNFGGATIQSNTYTNGKGVITFSGNITKAGDFVFYNRSKLSSIVLPNSVTSIGSNAFYNCSSLTTITIPNSVTSIGSQAFSVCVSLTEITIPNGVTSIGQSTFYNCSSLTTITIPNSVTSIGSQALSVCVSLTEITIPNGVTSIGNWAFENCYSLQNIICTPRTPPTGGRDMFYGVDSSAKIYVPAGSGAAYKAKQYWSDYASMIVEM